MNEHDRLLRLVPRRPTDYRPWGEVERWDDPNEADADCSGGCIHAKWLPGRLGADWCVCAREDGPRAGLLTFEHQAGRGCFESRRNRHAEGR